MLKKMSMIFCLMLCIISMSYMYASNDTKDVVTSRNLLDIGTYDKIYKMSEDSKITLPFIRILGAKASYDEPTDKTGLTVSAKSLDITNKMAGVQNIICGDTVTIDGNVEYANILAANVVIKGTVEKDSVIFAQSVFVTDTANIKGDLVIIGAGIAEINGTINGNAIVSSNDMKMTGTVGKDFRVSSNKIDIGEMNISGEIYIETASEINLSEKYPNATIVKIVEDTGNKKTQKKDILSEITDALIGAILYTLLYFIIRKISPNMFDNLSKKVKKYPGFTILMGFVTIVTIPAVLFLLIMLAIVGFGALIGPITVAYTAIIILAIWLAKFITGVVIFKLLRPSIFKEQNISWVKDASLLFLILIGMSALCMVPFISSYVTLATILVSAGSVATGMTRKLVKEVE